MPGESRPRPEALTPSSMPRGPQPLPDPQAPPARLAAELVARADDAFVALEAGSHVEKRLREAVRALFRKVTPETAASFVNAVAALRDIEDAGLAGVDASARAYLAASGVVPDARATQPEEAILREMRHDPAPAGTILRAVAPAWRNAKG